MAHQRLADFLHNSRFHEPRIERVAEMMKAAIADACAANCSFPSGLDYADGFAHEGEEQALLLAFSEKELVYAVGKGNFTAFASRGFGATDKEQVAVEVDVLPPLIEELAPTHAGVEGCYDDRTEVCCRCGKQLLFLIEP